MATRMYVCESAEHPSNLLIGLNEQRLKVCNSLNYFAPIHLVDYVLCHCISNISKYLYYVSDKAIPSGFFVRVSDVMFALRLKFAPWL